MVQAAIGTHAALVATGSQLRAWITPVLRGTDDRVMLPLPLFHVFAFAGARCDRIVAGVLARIGATPSR